MEMRHDHLPARLFAFRKLHQVLLRSRESPSGWRQTGWPERSGFTRHRHRAVPARFRHREAVLDALIDPCRMPLAPPRLDWAFLSTRGNESGGARRAQCRRWRSDGRMPRKEPRINPPDRLDGAARYQVLISAWDERFHRSLPDR